MCADEIYLVRGAELEYFCGVLCRDLKHAQASIALCGNTSRCETTITTQVAVVVVTPLDMLVGVS